VHELMSRTHGSTLLNIDEIETGSSLSNDELGLLSSKVVDVPSQQRDCLELMFFAAHGPKELL
jgi:hypothetical protein